MTVWWEQFVPKIYLKHPVCERLDFKSTMAGLKVIPKKSHVMPLHSNKEELSCRALLCLACEYHWFANRQQQLLPPFWARIGHITWLQFRIRLECSATLIWWTSDSTWPKSDMNIGNTSHPDLASKSHLCLFIPLWSLYPSTVP